MLPQLANFDYPDCLWLVRLNCQGAFEFVVLLNLVIRERLAAHSGCFNFFLKEDQAAVEGQLVLDLF